MELQNRERLKDVVDRIFKALSSGFPLAVAINALSLGLATNETSGLEGHLSTEDLDAQSFVDACVRWLKSAGYLEFYDGGFVFTEKGLQLVGVKSASFLPSPFYAS